MREMKTIWIWGLTLLILVSGMAVVGAAGNGSAADQKAALAQKGSWDPAEARAQADAALLQKEQDGLPLTVEEKAELERIAVEMADRNPGNPLDNQGGPDGFGYAYVDNVAPDTATYDWIELRGDAQTTWVNTWSGSHDDSYGPPSTAPALPIGFSFPFYGVNRDSFRLSTNGFIQFTTISNSLSNACLPSTSVGGPAIFPYWDDLHLDYGGITGGMDVIGFRNFGNYTVIEFDSIGHCCSPGVSLKFEVILFSDGKIKMQYNSLVFGNYANTQTIGIQSDGTAGSPALTYVCNTTGIQPTNGLAIWFALPDGIPNPVTNLSGSANGSNVTLTWTDPTQDINGNPLTPDSILIFRGNTQPGSQIGSIVHGVQTFSVTESQGNITYFVRAKAGTWLSTVVSTSVIVGTPGYANDFETDNGGWTADAGWTWGVASNANAPAPHGGTHMWGTGMSANYPASQCDHLDLAPGLIVNSANATVEFWAWWRMYPTYQYDGCNFKVSVDGGTTWQAVHPLYPYFTQRVYGSNTCMPNDSAWSETSNAAWQYVVIPIGEFNGQIPMFRFTFGTYVYTGYPGFFIDDMTIWGIASPPDGIPRTPTNLQGAANGNTVTLTWTDPNQDTNGNPLTPDSILIYRGDAQPGSQIGHVGSGVQTVVLPNEASGHGTYCIRAKYQTHLSLFVCTSVLVGNPTFNNGFDTDNGALIPIPDTGGWEWGPPTNSQGPQPHSAPNVWAIGLTTNYTNTVCDDLDVNLGLVVQSASASVEFWCWHSTESNYDGVNFRASTDEGATWQILRPSEYPYNHRMTTGTTNCIAGDSVWSGQSGGWVHVTIPIGQLQGEAPIFRFKFGSDASVTYPGFFLDDLIIWGLQAPQGANVSGNVNLNGGSGDVTQVLVTANGLGSPNTHPAANGSYTLTNVQVGDRVITATLPGYEQDTLHINLPVGGYTGANLHPRRLPPPPPTNVTGSVLTLARVDSLHWTPSTDVLVDGYRLYRKLSADPTFVLRQTIWGRNTVFVRDTFETDGVYNFVMTAIDTNMTILPWSESANSDTVTNPFGHLPPINLTADGNFDSHIHLAWNPPSTFTESYLRYDNGMNDVDGIGWWGGRPVSGWMVAHYQATGPVTVSAVRAYLTENATLGSPLEAGVFADDGSGHPGLVPLSVVSGAANAPLDAMHEWTLANPVTIESGSFFVGIRQMTNRSICLGGDDASPFITGTFFYNFDGGSWNAWEPDLLSVPMLSARVISASVEPVAPAPLVVRRLTAPETFLRVPATIKALTAPAASKLTAGASSSKLVMQTMSSDGSEKSVYSTVPSGEREPAAHWAWQTRQRLESSVGPRAPIIQAAHASHGHSGQALDDVLRYIICRGADPNSLHDSTTNAQTFTYDDNGLPENQSYNYWIRARYDDNQLSPPTNMVAAMCNMAPGAPTSVAVTAVGQTQMRITWIDPTVNADGTPCVDLAGLRVYRDSTLITVTPVAPGVQQYTDTPPDPMQVYTWTVRAIDEVPNQGAGASGAGSVISPWHTVEYNWVDISTIGTNTGLTNDDQNVGPFDLGFDFPFYGQTYNSIRVCSNGWASFNSTSTTYSNQHIPGTTTPTCALYPFWDDLYLPTGGSVMYYADAANQRFIIAWLAVPHIGSGGPYTFEIILDSNGGVTYQYQTTQPGQSITCGVENCDHSDAVELCYNGTGFWCPTDNSAVQFWGGPRQSITGVVSHSGGTNPVLSNVSVWITGGTDTVTTDNTGHYTMPVDSAGIYTVNFRHATHCDSIRPGVAVAENQVTTLDVALFAPNATLNVTSLTFVVRRYQTQPQTFTIQNNGGGCPLSFEVLDSVTWLSSNPASGTVNPGQTATITVTAAPGSIPVGDYSTVMRVVCNAPGSPFLLQVDMNVLTVDPGEPGLPKEFALHGNYPNPFNPTTVLPFDLPQQSQVDLIVYNVMGQEVARPVSGVYAAGRYNATFDAAGLPSGLYLVKMTAGHYTGMRKIMLLK